MRSGSPWLSPERGFPIFCRQGEALAGQPCWPDVGAAGECPVHFGHRRCSRDGEPAPRAPVGEHYGPGGDAFLVGLVVGEGDGLVISSRTL